MGFVGWFDYWDRLEALVDAVADLRAANLDVRLKLVGDGPVAAELNGRIRSRGLDGAAVLTGSVPRDEVPAHIESMDICVLPDSNSFGSPMVLFEFMAMGKAIVAPDLAPIRDVVADGETGIIIERGRVDMLTEAIGRLSRDPALRKRLGEQARKYVFERRTWAANAARIAAIAREIQEGRA